MFTATSFQWSPRIRVVVVVDVIRSGVSRKADGGVRSLAG
jgi:hypothetical protein